LFFLGGGHYFFVYTYYCTFKLGIVILGIYGPKFREFKKRIVEPLWLGAVDSFLHGFCLVAQMSMCTRTIFPFTE